MKTPYGAFEGRKDHMIIAGTDIPVLGARNFGKTSRGTVQASGSGLRLGVHREPGRLSRESMSNRPKGEPLYDERSGQFNASSNKELMEKFAMLMEGNQAPKMGGGNRARMFERQITPEYRQALAARTELLREAAAGGPNSAAHKIIGETLGREVFETMGRDGLARNIYMTDDLEEKGIARVEVRKKDVVAQISTSNINANRIMVRQHWVYPALYYILGFVSMEEAEIHSAGAEILDKKYQDLLEQFLVAEDKKMRTEWNASVGVFNPLLSVNTLTPLFFAQAKLAVDHWGIPCVRAAMAHNLWVDIAAQAEFASWFEPVMKHELALDGRLGSLMGVQILTDGFRYDTLRVLEDGEMFFFGPQVAVGTIIQQIPIRAEPSNRYNLGQPERGWFAFASQADVTLPRAISKIVRA